MSQPRQFSPEDTVFAHFAIPVLAQAYADVCKVNDKLECLVTRFQGQSTPAISICSYLQRIYANTDCSQGAFISSLVYLDKIQQFNMHRQFFIQSKNIHRLILGTVLVAAKFHDDDYFGNDYFALVGGVSLKEMNLLEVEVLKMINFDLSVSPSEFQEYQSMIQRRCRHAVLAAVDEAPTDAHVSANMPMKQDIAKSDTSAVDSATASLAAVHIHSDTESDASDDESHDHIGEPVKFMEYHEYIQKVQTPVVVV